MRVVYDDLVREYLDSLHSKLRNFSVEPVFLATWVHDEDDHVSLSELFAAAASAGAADFSVEVRAKTAAKLDRARLETALQAHGRPAITVEPDGSWIVEVDPSARTGAASAASVAATRDRPAGFVEKAAPDARRPGELHPAYRAALARLCSAPHREGPVPRAPEGGVVVEAAEGSAVLSIAVGANGVVTAASHRGAEGAARGLLDALCEVLPGRSFQEGRDHSVIRIEAALRDRAQPAPARGVVTPRTADPAFALPERAVRAAYREWARRTGAKDGWNFWDDQPAPAWRALSDEERLSRAQAAVKEAAAGLGDAAGVEVVELLGGCRIVLAATPETVAPKFAPKLMRMESLLKKALDPRIEVQLESLEDRNRRAERTQRSDRQL